MVLNDILPQKFLDKIPTIKSCCPGRDILRQSIITVNKC